MLSLIIMSLLSYASDYKLCGAGLQFHNTSDAVITGQSSILLDINGRQQRLKADLLRSDWEESNDPKWENSISNLNLLFSSSHYGNHYYIDFCLLGPAEDLMTTGQDQAIDNSIANYFFNVDLNLQGSPYIQAADLKARIDFSCDLRNSGNYTSARPENLEIPEGSYLEEDYYFSSTEINLGGIVSFNQVINTNRNKVPRFCNLRVYFRESAIAPRSSLVDLRDFFIDIQLLKRTSN